MRANELMSSDVHTCLSTDSLNHAAELMWNHDCGCVPVVDTSGRAIGMLTDRDICMAAYTQGRPLSEIMAATAASQSVFGVRAEDPISEVERVMRVHQVRRVPVLDFAGRPVGIISMNDLARNAHPGRLIGDGLKADKVLQTLQAIGSPAGV